MKKKKLNKGFWSRTQQYVQDAETYIKESKNYILGAALFFASCIFIGFVFADSFTFLNHIIAELRQSVIGLDGIPLSLAIFKANTTSAFFSLFLGLLLGIFSVSNISINGTLIGYVIHVLWQESGATHLWKLLPHGIFELPALFISWGLGIKLGMFIFTKNHGKKFKYYLFRIVRLLFFYYIITLLLIIFLLLIKWSLWTRVLLLIILLIKWRLWKKLWVQLCMFIFSKDEFLELKHRSFGAIKVFLFIVIPLLFVAAIIEGILITFLT